MLEVYDIYENTAAIYMLNANSLGEVKHTSMCLIGRQKKADVPCCFLINCLLEGSNYATSLMDKNLHYLLNRDGDSLSYIKVIADETCFVHVKVFGRYYLPKSEDVNTGYSPNLTNYIKGMMIRVMIFNSGVSVSSDRQYTAIDIKRVENIESTKAKEAFNEIAPNTYFAVISQPILGVRDNLWITSRVKMTLRKTLKVGVKPNVLDEISMDECCNIYLKDKSLPFVYSKTVKLQYK